MEDTNSKKIRWERVMFVFAIILLTSAAVYLVYTNRNQKNQYDESITESKNQLISFEAKYKELLTNIYAEESVEIEQNPAIEKELTTEKEPITEQGSKVEKNSKIVKPKYKIEKFNYNTEFILDQNDNVYYSQSSKTKKTISNTSKKKLFDITYKAGQYAHPKFIVKTNDAYYLVASIWTNHKNAPSSGNDYVYKYTAKGNLIWSKK